MGILNATPDSFFNKGRDSDAEGILRNANSMIEEGASILDVGGASTKPGAAIIDPVLEQERVAAIIEAIRAAFPEIWISADTYHASTARVAVLAGADIINDVSAGSIDSNMMQTVAGLKVPYIAMHMQGTPATMQQYPQYEDVVYEVRDYLRNAVDQAVTTGITDVIIDPGFGFGKTVEHNFHLLRGLHTFRMLGKPVLAGISRKSMICRTLGITPEYALNGTTALHMVALQQGAGILRVHDVKEAMEVIQLFHALNTDGDQ